jgi:hypothetical protein
VVLDSPVFQLALHDQLTFKMATGMPAEHMATMCDYTDACRQS